MAEIRWFFISYFAFHFMIRRTYHVHTVSWSRTDNNRYEPEFVCVCGSACVWLGRNIHVWYDVRTHWYYLWNQLNMRPTWVVLCLMFWTSALIICCDFIFLSVLDIQQYATLYDIPHSHSFKVTLHSSSSPVVVVRVSSWKYACHSRWMQSQSMRKTLQFCMQYACSRTQADEVWPEKKCFIQKTWALLLQQFIPKQTVFRFARKP